MARLTDRLVLWSNVLAPGAGLLLLLAFLLTACAPSEGEIRQTVEHSVMLAAAATQEARPTPTPYPSATVYATATTYSAAAAGLLRTAYPTATRYPTATPYPTYTATSTATPAPLPTRVPDAAQVAAPVSTSGDVRIDIVRVMTEARDILVALRGSLGSEIDCPSFVAGYERLANAPVLDVSSAPIEFQSAYQRYREIITEMTTGPSGLTDMIAQCRDLIAQGQPVAHFDDTFVGAVYREPWGYGHLTEALKSIGGE